MRYLAMNVVPREDGTWYATVSARDTRAVRGQPRSLGSMRPVYVSGVDREPLERVIERVLAALAVEDGHAPARSTVEPKNAQSSVVG